jgi:hypothetical protein
VQRLPWSGSVNLSNIWQYPSPMPLFWRGSQFKQAEQFVASDGHNGFSLAVSADWHVGHLSVPRGRPEQSHFLVVIHFSFASTDGLVSFGSKS